MRLPDPCTVAEAARWLGVSTQAVRLRVASKKLHPVKGTPSVAFKAADIQAWQDERIAAARKVLAK